MPHALIDVLTSLSSGGDDFVQLLGGIFLFFSFLVAIWLGLAPLVGKASPQHTVYTILLLSGPRMFLLRNLLAGELQASVCYSFPFSSRLGILSLFLIPENLNPAALGPITSELKDQ